MLYKYRKKDRPSNLKQTSFAQKSKFFLLGTMLSILIVKKYSGKKKTSSKSRFDAVG